MFFPSSLIIYHPTTTLPSYTHTLTHLLNASVTQVLSAGVEGDDCIVQKKKQDQITFLQVKEESAMVCKE